MKRKLALFNVMLKKNFNPLYLNYAFIFMQNKNYEKHTLHHCPKYV